MKYNKGFAPVLIALIVIGILVIGGGGYYLGVNKNVEKEKENIKEDSIPSIEILSLKKIEQLVIGSKYTIVYKTNLAPKDGIVFLFVGTGEKNKWMKIVPSENNDSFSIASNSYIWTIPKEICGVEVCNSLVVGEKYKIKAVLTGTINNQFQDIASYVSDSYFTITSTSEESTTEVFKHQPGAIKSMAYDGAEFSVDLLSGNPNWEPGNDSTGGFFLNQNSKIRKLNVNNATIIKNCKSQNPDYYSGFENNLLSFTTYVQDKIDKGLVGNWGYTAYFDITGPNITAIYEQCLP